MEFYRKIITGLEWLVSLPKSFFLSWRLTSFRRALYLPVVCRYNVKVLRTSGRLIGTGTLSIGFNRTHIYDTRNQRSIVNIEGVISINGHVSIGAGSRIDVLASGTLVFEGNVSNSAGVVIICNEKIEIGNNTVISWDTLILDSDFHYVMNTETGLTRPMNQSIIIGENTWLCAGSKVLKGSILPNGCILSAGSVLNKKFHDNNCLLQGNPAIVTRKGVTRCDYEYKD